MQHKFLLPILMALFLGTVTAVIQAQDEPAGQPKENLIIVEDPPKQRIDGVADLPERSMAIQGLSSPMSFAANKPADNCHEAPLLILTPDRPDGSSADIRNATLDKENDPVLACMWGNPASKQGHRTVWYQVAATDFFRVNIDMFDSTYDTVVAAYRGTCDNLTPIACNDDTNGFTSELSFTVDRIPEPADSNDEKEKYYVEIANWKGGFGEEPVMQLSAYLEPIDSRWDFITSKPSTPAISRHAVVSQGQYVYVVGGQTFDEDGSLMSNRVERFDTVSERWEQLASFPDFGYSNTTAALLNNHIYVPMGYTGDPDSYDKTHWAYDIAQDSWKFVKPIPEKDLPYGEPFAWSAAVVPPSQNRYYLTGGTVSSEFLVQTDRVSSETYSYDPAANSWNKLKPMQAGRYGHTAGWIETNNLGICVAGGLGGVSSNDDQARILHRSVECYQPGGNWHYLGDMQIPRYGAGSVIGPDGNWYVFGGIGQDGKVAQTEVFNPVSRTWSILDPSFNLATYDSFPPRFWPRGAMVGEYLWVVGGSIDGILNEQALAAIDRLHIPRYSHHLPITMGDSDDPDRPDDSFATARGMAFGGRQTRNFDRARDWFDNFYFDLGSERRVNIQLEVPEDNDFDLELYGVNKTRWGESITNLNGVDESISLVLQPRRYYIRVIRSFPTQNPDKDAYYTLKLD